MKDFLETTSVKNPDLKTAEVRGLFYILYSKDRLENNELIRLTGIPKTIMKTFKASISDILSNVGEDEIKLNEKGLGLLGEMDLKPYKWSLLEHDLVKEEDKIFEIRVKYGLEPKREYDQFFATPRSTVEKAKMLMDKDLVDGKRIALVGDDDLVSIALGIMTPTYKKITIYDIDKRILDLISKVAADYGIENIETVQHDVRKDFTKAALGKHDVVLIDPPYTKSGAKLFLHRAIELLRVRTDFQGSYVFLNYGVGLRNPLDTIKIQDVINQYSLVIEDKLNKYTRYFGAETVGSASSIYVLKTTPLTSTEDKVLQDAIYTFENTDTDDFPFVDQFTFKLQKIPKEILKSKTKLQKLLGTFCNKHKLNVVETKVTKFKGQGLSFTYILSNSNLVVHTWPEKSALHIDLITCTPVHNKEVLAHTLSDLFKTKFVETLVVE